MVVNLVATADLHQSVNVRKLAIVEGFRYDPKVYHCAYLKDKKTNAKVSIFATGKMISVGAKRIIDAEHDLNYAARRLSELGLITTAGIKVRLRNLVATSDLHQAVDLENLSRIMPDFIYEPAQFPGAIFHSSELEGASMLIFASGKVVFAGLKNQKLIDAAQQMLLMIAQCDPLKGLAVRLGGLMSG